MLRALAAAVGAFAGALAILVIAVGQLGRIDRQTLVVAVVLAGAAAAVAGWRQLRA